ncbi:MAG: hypothetical protein AAB262_07080 [Elusimicrobiota bacterium]
MTLSAEARKALTTAVTAGVKDCAAKLGEVTFSEWNVDGVTLSLDEAGPFADLLASIDNDHYGAHLSFPGGSFLVLCTSKSGYLITNAFTRAVPDRVESIPKREARSLGEVSNIMLNAMLGHFAKAWDRDIIISSPKTGIAKQRDHLAKALALYREEAPLAATFLAKLASRRLLSECLLLIFLDKDSVEKIAGR